MRCQLTLRSDEVTTSTGATNGSVLANLQMILNIYGKSIIIMNSTLLDEIISTNNLPYIPWHCPTRGKMDASKETQPFSDH